MMRAAILFSFSLATVNLFGCAWFTTYQNDVDLENTSVSIDAKQRIITSHKNKRMDQVVICAEPSPDALAVLGASGALTGSSTSGSGGSASLGLGESGASIGLRTQSIQLLRDLNYRICEAYANDAIDYAEAAALLRRGQSTMMGLIAIEQLTGPVVASQVALSSSVTAGTGGSSGDLAAAQNAVTTAKENLLKAQAEVDTATTEHQKDIKAVEDANKILSEAAKADNPDQTTIDSLTTTLQTAQDKAKISDNVLKDKQRRAKSAEEELAYAKSKLLEAERGRTAAGVAASGQMGEVARANAKNTEALAKEVRGIVEDINKSYFVDTCFSLVSRAAFKAEEPATKEEGVIKKDEKLDFERQIALETALKVCTNLLQGQAAKLQKIN